MRQATGGPPSLAGGASSKAVEGAQCRTLCPDRGRFLKTFFTIHAAARYTATMLWIAALIAAQEPPPPAAGQPRQARAMVRILQPAVIAFDTGTVTSDVASAERRQSAFRLPDGSRQPLKLLEFQ